MASRVRVCILTLAFALFVALPAVSAAQGPISIGVKAGVNIATVKFAGPSDEPDDAVKSLLGAVAGLYVITPVNDTFSLRVEGLFSQKGFQSAFVDEDGGEQPKARLTYIDVPVLLDFSPATTSATRFHVFTGPQLSLKTGAEVESDSGTVDASDEVKGTDFAWVLGVGVANGRWSGDVRYGFGLSNIAEAGNRVKNRVFSVTVGVRVK